MYLAKIQFLDYKYWLMSILILQILLKNYKEFKFFRKLKISDFFGKIRDLLAFFLGVSRFALAPGFACAPRSQRTPGD